MCQRKMNCKVTERIKQVHWAQGPEIQEMYLWLGLSPEAARLLVREQELYSPKKLRVLTDKNVDDICNVVKKPGCNNSDEMPI